MGDLTFKHRLCSTSNIGTSRMLKEVLEKADYKVARAGIVGGPILGFFAVPQLACFGQRLFRQLQFFKGWFMSWNCYPLVNVYITMGNHMKSPFLMGKLTINGHFQ
jgi:hypothetical protein